MPVQFVFLVLPQLHLLDLAGPDQAIHEAIGFGADFSIAYCGLGGEAQTSAGLPFGELPHFSAMKLSAGDYLMLAGANTSLLTSDAFKQQVELFQWINNLYQDGVNICSICVGAYVLAEAGLLDDKTCTTHFKKTADLQQRYPAAKVVENILFTVQDGLYTSAGIAAGIDLTLHIIEKLQGSYFAHLVARELVVYGRRAGSAAQESELLKFRAHIHEGIHKVQDWIADNLPQKMKLSDLAAMANMSERNFTRVFKKETGTTVNQYLTAIRREKIRALLKSPDLSKVAIANEVGLESEKQVKRILKSAKI